MNKNKYQSGSGHLIIIVLIVVVALIGVLSFVFFDKFMGKKDDSNKTTTTTVIATTTQEYSDSNPISFTYPQSWEIEKESYPDTGVNYIRFIKPDSDVTVSITYSTPPSDVRSKEYITCNNIINPQYVLQYSEKTAGIPNAELVEYFYMNGDKVFQIDTLLNNTAEGCVGSSVLYFADGKSTTDINWTLAFYAEIYVTGYSEFRATGSNPLREVSEVTDYLASNEDYQVAKDILLSARIN